MMLHSLGFICAIAAGAIVGLAAAERALGQEPAQLVGVGIAIEADANGNVWITKVLPGGPAESAGIREMDELLAIDGRSVSDLPAEQLPSLIRGAEGSEVTLTVRAHSARPRRLSIKRALVVIPPGMQPPPLPQEQPQRTEGRQIPSQPAGEPPRNPRAASPARNPLAAEPPRDPLAEPSTLQPARNPLADPTPAASTPPTTLAPGAAGSTGTMKFTRLSVKDPGINNIEAVSLLVPVGWKSEGGIQWFHDYAVLANLLMKITDPQTGAQIELLPIQHFTWLTQMVVPMQPGTNYLGRIIWQPIGDAPTFIQTFYVPQVLPHLQGARPMAQEDLPKIAATVAQSFNDGGQTTVKATRVRYAYERNGQPWEEDVYLAITYTNWQLGTMWAVQQACSFRAPAGRLDAMTPVMLATVNSAQISPDWFGGYMYVRKLFENRMNQDIANATKLSQIITRNNEEIRRMSSEAYRARQESQDRINESFGEYIRGVDTYKNPYEDRPVQLPAGYNDAWVNARGEYILTNEGGYNPNVGDTTEWRRMDRRQ